MCCQAASWDAVWQCVAYDSRYVKIPEYILPGLSGEGDQVLMYEKECAVLYKYVAKRLIYMIPVLLGVSFLVYVIGDIPLSCTLGNAITAEPVSWRVRIPVQSL